MFGFYFILLFHTFGMSLVVGSNMVVDLRILGVASNIPLHPLKRLFRIGWAGFGLNAVTGLLLLTAYPTKELTNPDFYCKLTFIALAIYTMRKMSIEVFGDPNMSEAAMMVRGKMMAGLSLFFWFSAVCCGRLLSETSRYFIYGHPAGG
jgi:ABC-type Fe3+ transport system permease subunit